MTYLRLANCESVLFWWGIEPHEDGTASVVESYNHMDTWIRNCTLGSSADCVRFIEAWIHDMGGESPLYGRPRV